MITVIVFYFYVILAAIILDLLIGDPRWLPHPVIIIGKVISKVEKTLNSGKLRKLKGTMLTIMIVIGTFICMKMILSIAGLIHPFVAVFIEIYFISTTIAIKGLQRAAKDVAIPLKNKDLPLARKKLSYIVGRDTEDLPTQEVVRGTVETVAENTVDAIIAPLFWGLIGGAPLAMAYRAINTLDSMVGYKNDRYRQFGWASARLDDLVNWVPARLTALCIWLFSWLIPHAKKRNGLVVTLRDAKKHPSPNSGWPEAMTAGLLGVELGGLNYYQGLASHRATMGNPIRVLVPKDIRNSIIYMNGAWITFMLILFIFVSSL